MNHGCKDFRSRLERCLLAGRPAKPFDPAKPFEPAKPAEPAHPVRSQGPGELQQLGWHEHLLACPACRALLEGEQALELLLATLPEPELPPELARRIVARLRAAHAARDPLDALLELDALDPAPVGLARRVLAGIGSGGALPGHAHEPSPELETRLDALLDRALAQVAAPPRLAQAVLRGLAARRSPRRPRMPLAWRVAAAALLLLGVGWLALGRLLSGPGGAPDGTLVGGRAPDADASVVSDELLASLDVLEAWGELEDSGLLIEDELVALATGDAVLLELLIAAVPEEFAETDHDRWPEPLPDPRTPPGREPSEAREPRRDG